jgi:hypothetical protein
MDDPTTGAGPAGTDEPAGTEEPAGIGDYASALADAIEAALPAWVQASVARVMTAWAGAVAPDVAAAAVRAGDAARDDIGARVRALVAMDIDEQPTTPLALIRTAVRYPTEVLAAAGVPEVERDSFAVNAFPADVYALSPATWSDLGPEVGEAGIVWGAAKAFEHLRRHRP